MKGMDFMSLRTESLRKIQRNIWCDWNAESLFQYKWKAFAGEGCWYRREGRFFDEILKAGE